MKKFLLASLIGITAATSLATASEAHHRWRHRHWHGGPAFGIVIGGPRYIHADADYCYVRKVRRYNRWGELVIRRVTICD
jgi:hypothetical protein